MNTATDSLEVALAPSSDGGVVVGNAITDLVGFYGVAPVAQPSAASQAAIVDGSLGVAAPTNGVAALTGTYNSTILNGAIATIISQTNAIRAALVSVGIIKGS